MTAGDLRLEVWSRPGANPFERIDIQPPGPFNFTKRAATGIGRGQLTIPITYDRINELIRRTPGDPATDVRRLARVYAEGVTLPVYEFFLDVTGDEAVETDVTLDGNGVESIMADGIVYPWDWDGQLMSESLFPDWIWGGRDIVGPVETTFQPHIARVWTTATGGSFQFGVSINGGAYEYATINFNDSAFQVQTAVIGLGNVDSASVQGAGTEANPWEISITGPAGTYTVALGTISLTGPSPTARLEVVQFGKLIPLGWTESRVDNSTVPHGVLTDFRASLGGGGDPALPAECSAWVVFLGQEYLFPGVEKIVNVTPGSIFQIPPLYLYAQGASAQVRIVIRDMQEGFIAAEEITIPSNTLTLSVGLTNVMIPEGITQVKFRVGHIGAGTPPRIFIACPSMREGLAPTSAGGIFTQLFQDATVNHVADGRIVWENLASVGTTFLDLSFTTTVDSAGVGWDNMEMDFTAKRGQNYLQVLQNLANRGYRWSVIPSNTAGRWLVNLYNPTWIKVDASALTTPAINVGSGVTSGPIFRSHLTGNAITVEGFQMKFGRSESALSIAAIGRREVYQPDRSITTTDAAAIRAASEVSARLLAGLSVAVNIEPVNSPVPFVDYDVDWNINVQIPPALPKSAHLVASITATVTDAGTSYKASFSSESFTGTVGAVEGVRRLLEKYEGFEREAPQGLSPAAGDVLYAGSLPPIVIAAFDTRPLLKDLANYICTGTNDQDTIRQAIVDLNQVNAAFSNLGTYGTLLFLDGTYIFDNYCLLDTEPFGKLQFVGDGMPRFLLDYNTSPAPMFLLTGGGSNAVEQTIRFRNIKFDGANFSNGHFMRETTLTAKATVHVAECVFKDFNLHVWWSERQAPYFIHDSEFYTCEPSDGMFHFDTGTTARRLIHDNNFISCTGDMVSGFDFGDHTLISNNTRDQGTLALNVKIGVTYADNLWP